MRILLLLFWLTMSAPAAVLLDDDWDDADRTDTNLPEESAWFGSMAASSNTLSAVSNALIGNVRVDANVSSRLWITHFTPAGSPAELGVGDTLKVTLVFVPSNVVAASATQRGLRFGLFNFSEPGASRVAADGFSTGAGTGAPGIDVTGYMLNMSFAQTLTSSPLQIMKRIDLATNNLMGATGGGVYSALGSGGGGAGPGFSNGVPYTMQFVIRRPVETAVQITTTFSDADGWSISHTVTDTASPTFRFDGFAIRPNGAADTADAFIFTQLKVETIPFELKIISADFPSFQLLRLRWNAVPNRTYEVYWRDGLEAQHSWNLLGSTVANDSTATMDDGDVGFFSQRFYRVFQVP